MPPTRTTVDQSQAATVPSEISVSIVAAKWRAFFSAARWKPMPGVEDDRRREGERDPLPAREAQRRHHRQQRDRQGQHDREPEPPREHGDRLVVMVVPAGLAMRSAGGRRGRVRVVAGRLDRADELVDGDGRVAVDGRLLGREVDRRLDAVELVQLLLDPRGAGGAGHPLEVEPELDRLRGLVGEGSHHAASYPASSIAARSAVSSSLSPRTTTRFVSRSTATDSTPSTRFSSELTACLQWLAAHVGNGVGDLAHR